MCERNRMVSAPTAVVFGVWKTLIVLTSSSLISEKSSLTRLFSINCVSLKHLVLNKWSFCRFASKLRNRVLIALDMSSSSESFSCAYVLDFNGKQLGIGEIHLLVFTFLLGGDFKQGEELIFCFVFLKEPLEDVRFGLGVELFRTGLFLFVLASEEFEERFDAVSFASSVSPNFWDCERLSGFFKRVFEYDREYEESARSKSEEDFELALPTLFETVCWTVRLRLGRSGNRVRSLLEDLVEPHVVETDGLARFPFFWTLASGALFIFLSFLSCR